MPSVQYGEKTYTPSLSLPFPFSSREFVRLSILRSQAHNHLAGKLSAADRWGVHPVSSIVPLTDNASLNYCTGCAGACGTLCQCDCHPRYPHQQSSSAPSPDSDYVFRPADWMGVEPDDDLTECVECSHRHWSDERVTYVECPVYGCTCNYAQGFRP